MNTHKHNPATIAELATLYKAPWAQRGMQASLLLAHQTDLDALPSMIPAYDAVAQEIGTCKYKSPATRKFDTNQIIRESSEQQTAFEPLLAERNALHSNLLPALQTVQSLIKNFYKDDDRNKPTVDNDLSNCLNKTLESHSYQYTLEQLYDTPFESILTQAVARLENDKQYVPTNEVLQRTGRTRAETNAEYDKAIAALQEAYGQLQVFQIRAKALNEAVLPKLQERYAACADSLAAICTKTADGILENPAQYFAPGRETSELPNQSSRALGPLRTILQALRCKDGSYGLSPAKTAREGYIKNMIAHALQMAEKERTDMLTGANGTAILQSIDAVMRSSSPEAPAQQTDTTPSTSNDTLHAGETPKRRTLIQRILGNRSN